MVQVVWVMFGVGVPLDPHGSRNCDPREEIDAQVAQQEPRTEYEIAIVVCSQEYWGIEKDMVAMLIVRLVYLDHRSMSHELDWVVLRIGEVEDLRRILRPIESMAASSSSLGLPLKGGCRGSWNTLERKRNNRLFNFLNWSEIFFHTKSIPSSTYTRRSVIRLSAMKQLNANNASESKIHHQSILRS